jgi:hypothetical protein
LDRRVALDQHARGGLDAEIGEVFDQRVAGGLAENRVEMAPAQTADLRDLFDRDPVPIAVFQETAGQGDAIRERRRTEGFVEPAPVAVTVATA